MRSALKWAVLVSVVAPACVGGSKQTSEADLKRLKAYILDEAPKDLPNKLNIVFSDKLDLIGYRLQPNSNVKPGQKVTITMYWRARKKIDAGWNLFTHVLDGSGERILNIDNVGPLREWRDSGQVLGPSNWQVGKVYADEQSFTVPSSLKSSKLQIVTGVWKDSDRLPVTTGTGDRENRAVVANLTAQSRAEPPPVTRVPMLRSDKLPGGTKPKIDGKLDDDVWKSAPSTGPFVDVSTGRRNATFPVNATVKVLWDDQGMYLGFDVKDPDVTGGFDRKLSDPHLWTKDTVEIMVDPEGDGDNKDYYEIQINPQNLVFDSQFDDYNQPKKDPDGPFGHQEWSASLKSAVTINGTIDQPADRDQGYVVEAMLPWSAFNKTKKVPPAPGDIWRINFYAMQNNSGVAWSAILQQGNFHKASRFGRVLFAEKGWTTPGRVAPAGSGVSDPALRRLPVRPGMLPRSPRLPTPPAPSAR
jgi:hypothetical protein